MRTIALGIAMVACAITGAVAQTAVVPAPATPAPATSAPAPSTTVPGAAAVVPGAAPGGLSMASTATLAVKYVTVQPADFMTSRLMGATVYNNQNESIGEVEDLVIENGKTVKGVVVAIGGFLGLGETYVVLDPSTVVLNQRDNTWRAYVDTSKDSLKNAPKFTYTKMKR